MKIWVQSATAIGKDARVNRYGESLKKHIEKVARPGTTVHVHGVEVVTPRPDMYLLSKHVQISNLIRNTRKAQEEGYDAFVVVCTLDPGFHELREMLDIPVVFILETLVQLACLLSPKFSFLAHNRSLLLRIVEKVKQYGLQERMTPGVYLDFSHSDFNAMYENPRPYLDAFLEKGKKLVEQGANMIIVSGTPSQLFLGTRGAGN